MPRKKQVNKDDTRSLAKPNSNYLINGKLSAKIKPRFEMVLNEVSKGTPKREIIDKLCERFDIKSSHAENIYSASFKWLQSTSSEERKYLREKHESMLMNLYRINIENGDFKEAHAILQTLNKMFGIEKREQEVKQTQNTFEFRFNIAPTQVDVISTTNDVIDVDYEDYDKDEE